MICLFGGTFDPVHLGHLHAAEAVCDALALPEIRLVLSARPSHRGKTGASLAHRWAMLELACAERPRLHPDDREMRRQRPSYTVDTLEALRAEYPRETLTWVIGSDAYALLPGWYRWESVLRLANLVVLKRPGHPLLPDAADTADDVMARLTREHRVASLDGCHEGGIFVLEDAMRAVAAEDIRAALAAGAPVDDLLPEPVAAYIRAHGLYREPE